MSTTAAVTVYRSREEVERLWEQSNPDMAATFRDAPGDRGTEVHVDLQRGGKLNELAQMLTGPGTQAKVKDQLRRFKQVVETGEVPRSEGTPEGEAVERKLKQRPAQPLDESELQKAGA